MPSPRAVQERVDEAPEEEEALMEEEEEEVREGGGGAQPLRVWLAGCRVYDAPLRSAAPLGVPQQQLPVGPSFA